MRIVDIAESYFGGSRGKGIQPRSLELLDMAGLADEVMGSATLYPFFKMHVGPLAFRAWSLGTRHPASEDRPFPNLMMLAQSQTEAILRARVEALGGRVELGAGIAALAQSSDEVKVTLTTGEVVSAPNVVGCDGGRSTTRRLLGLKLVGSSVDAKTSIVADLRIDNLDPRFWHAYPLRRGGLHTLAPLPGGELFQLQAPESIAADGLKSGVERLCGERVREVVWESRYAHQTRMVDRYRMGRVFLAGDAAHIHPPSGAQGLNTGMQDAFNLGWKLASALRTGDDAILDSYQAERLPVAAAMLDLTRTLHTTVSKSRGDQTNQLGLSYAGGPLAQGPARNGFRPGDRMPDQRLADGGRLYEAMRHGGATRIVHGNGETTLVRPDGYVADSNRSDLGSYFGHDVVDVRGIG